MRDKFCLALALLGLWACDDGTDAAVDAAVRDAEADSAPLDSTPRDAELDSTPRDAELDSAPDSANPDTAADAGLPPDEDLDQDGLTNGEERALGTDPALSDTDGDGYLDGAEVGAGTNPSELSSAPAWFPERLSGRPRLYFGPELLPTLKARAQTPSPGHAALLARLTQLAQQSPASYPEDQSYDVYVPPQRAAIAEARAFLALLGDDLALAESAAELLAAPFPDPSGLGAYSKYDLTESEAMVSYCSAFDLLAAVPGLDVERRAAAEVGLREHYEVFSRTILSGQLLAMVALTRNNHGMKAQAALAFCALALNDRPEHVRRLHEGLTALAFVLREVQGDEEGGYAEGPNYLAYGGNTWLPFLVAYHRFARGETLSYRAVGQTALPFPQARQRVAVPDLATDERVRLIHLRALEALQPDGRTAPFDDANPVKLHGALLASLFEDDRYLWHWDGAFAADRAEVASFALYDGREPPPAPALPDLCRPIAGFCVLREPGVPFLQARYLTLIGEHGGVRVNGVGHEQEDNTSLALWAFGEPLLLDPGYINWANRERVAHTADHSRILIDGEGPVPENPVNVDADAWLSGPEVQGPFTALTVDTEWSGVAHRRQVVRVGAGELFVVADTLEAAEPHTYTHLLHGNAMGEAFSRLDGGARWLRPGASLTASVQATAPLSPLTQDTVDDEHQAGWGGEAWHTVLRTHAEQAEAAGFLTVLTPPLRSPHSPPMWLGWRPLGWVRCWWSLTEATRPRWWRGWLLSPAFTSSRATSRRRSRVSRLSSASGALTWTAALGTVRTHRLALARPSGGDHAARSLSRPLAAGPRAFGAALGMPQH